MACSTPQVIAMSARVAPSTVAHVLRLVGSSYLEAAGPSRIHRKRPLAIKVTRRFASSVPSRVRDHLERDDLVHERTPKKEPYLPLPEPVLPQWAELDASTTAELFRRPRPSAVDFRKRFGAVGSDPSVILPAGRLLAVAKVFCAKSTSWKDWEWLLETLNAIKDAKPSWDELPMSEPLFRVLRGMAMAEAMDYDSARANVAVGLKLAMEASPSTGFFPENVYFVLGHYIQLCRDKGRIEDVAVAVRYAGAKLQKLLCHTSSHYGLSPSARRARQLLHDALNELRDPVKWLEGQFNVRGRDGGLSRANYLLSDVLFTALVFDRSRTSDAFSFWFTVRKRLRYTSLAPSVASQLGKYLALDGHMDPAKQVFEALHHRYPELPHSAMSNELWAYATKGMVDEAHEVWERLIAGHRPSRADWIAYANAYAYRGDVEGVNMTLTSLCGPDFLKSIDCLTVLQRASIYSNDAEGALHYIQLARELSPTASKQMCEALLQLYAKQANVDDAVKLFESMMGPTPPSKEAYTTLISVFANKANYANAVLVFNSMKDAGHEPDAFAWSALLNASIEAGEWLLASQQCAEIPPALLSDSGLATTVLKAYVLVRAPNNVIMKLFRRIHKPQLQAWSLVIQAAADDSNQVLARNLFSEMDENVAKDPLAPAPNVFIFSTLLAMYLRAGDRDSSRAVYDTMIFRNVLPTSVTYGIITTSYANSPGESSVEQAHNFAMSVYNRTIATELPHARGQAAENVFGSLLIAAGRNKDMERAQKYFSLVQSTGQDTRTLNHKLLEAYRRNGQVKPLYRLWLRLFKNAVTTVPRKPTKSGKVSRIHDNVLCVPLSITLKAFAEAGLHDRLKQVWMSVRTSGFGFDSHNYDHMANALARTGDVMGAMHIVDRVLLPRYDEVRRRYNMAMREGPTLFPVDLETTPGDLDVLEANGLEDEAEEPADPTIPNDTYSTDDVAEYGPRGSNRRHEITLPNRSDREVEHAKDSEAHESGRQGSISEPPPERTTDLDILRFWRPSDILWRPSHETVYLLTQVYDQLERQSKSNNSWGVGASFGDEADEDDPDAPVLRLPDFNNVTVKNDDGSPKRTSPRALLMRINKRYSRAVALISFHRRKNSGRS